jgi:hypothetical protein
VSSALYVSPVSFWSSVSLMICFIVLTDTLR